MLTFDTFYPSDIHITDQTLLLNIETTGLSPRNAFVFMIGLGWQEEKGWHFQCLLAEKKMDERELMQSFRQILENFSQVLTYGGHSFTYRFLNNRWRNYSDADCFSSEDTADLTLFQSVRQLDIQKDISPFRHLLSLENTRKATAEAFIRYTRPEHLDPEALVKCYTSWELSKEDTLLLQLKAHHEDRTTPPPFTLCLYTIFQGKIRQSTSLQVRREFLSPCSLIRDTGPPKGPTVECSAFSFFRERYGTSCHSGFIR